MWMGMLDPGKMTSAGGVGERPSIGTLAAVTLAFSPHPCLSTSPFMTLVHSKLLSLCQSLGWVSQLRLCVLVLQESCPTSH